MHLTEKETGGKNHGSTRIFTDSLCSLRSLLPLHPLQSVLPQYLAPGCMLSVRSSFLRYAPYCRCVPRSCGTHLVRAMSEANDQAHISVVSIISSISPIKNQKEVWCSRFMFCNSTTSWASFIQAQTVKITAISAVPIKPSMLSVGLPVFTRRYIQRFSGQSPQCRILGIHKVCCFAISCDFW